MRQGYTAPQVCKIVGISYRQLDHWTTSKLVKASIRSIKGSGHHREYAFDDLLRVKVIKNDKDLITFGYINDPIKIIIEEFNGNQLTLKLSNKIILNYNTSTSSSISIVSNLLTWLFRL